MTLAQVAIATLIGSTLPGTILLSMRICGVLGSPAGRGASYRSRLRSAASASACVAAAAATAAATAWHAGAMGAAIAAGATAIGSATIGLACACDSAGAYSDEARALIIQTGVTP